MTSKASKVLIIGGGFSGMAAAIELRRQGVEVDLVEIDTEAIAKGRRLSYLIDHLVLNEKDEIIGTIEDLIVDDHHKLFAVLEVGDFLHRGSGPLIAIPYDRLSIDEERLTIRLPGASREKLNKVPVFEYRR